MLTILTNKSFVLGATTIKLKQRTVLSFVLEVTTTLMLTVLPTLPFASAILTSIVHVLSVYLVCFLCVFSLWT